MPKSGKPADETIEDELLWALGKEVLRLTRRRIMLPQGSQLDQSAFRILWALSELGPLSMSALGELIQLEQSTVSRQVSAAMRQGLVDQQLVPGTRRRQVIPTSAGLEAFRHENELRGKMFRAALQTIGRDRARSLAVELQALNDAMDSSATHN